MCLNGFLVRITRGRLPLFLVRAAAHWLHIGRKGKISVLEPTSSLLLVLSPRTRLHEPISGMLCAPEGE